MDTQEALFEFNVLIRRCMDVNQLLDVWCIYYDNALDKVLHNPLIQLFKDKRGRKRHMQ